MLIDKHLSVLKTPTILLEVKEAAQRPNYSVFRFQQFFLYFSFNKMVNISSYSSKFAVRCLRLRVSK